MCFVACVVSATKCVVSWCRNACVRCVGSMPLLCAAHCICLGDGQGDVLHVEKMIDAEVGKAVDLDQVLLVGSRGA